MVLRAAAGVGKSRLAREANAAAAADGLPAIWVQATRSASAIPLGAFADLIPDDVRSDDTLELLRRSGDALRERARDRRVVLGVDDAQLLDPVSAALVLHLAATATAFVVATVRSGEPVPDAIESLWKDAGAQRLELEQLSDEAVAALVERGLGGPVEQGAVEWVIASSQGNALYVARTRPGRARGRHAPPPERAVAAQQPPARERHAARARRPSGWERCRLRERVPIELLALAEPLRIDELTALAGPRGVRERRGARADRDRRAAPTRCGSHIRSTVRRCGPSSRDCGRSGCVCSWPRRSRRAIRSRPRRRCASRGCCSTRSRRCRPACSSTPRARPSRRATRTSAGASPSWRCDDGAGLGAALLLARAHTARKRHAEADAVLEPFEAEAETEASGDYVEQRVLVLYWGLRDVEAARAYIERAGTWARAARGSGGWRRCGTCWPTGGANSPRRCG